MSFESTLIRVLESADYISMDNYALDDDMIEFRSPNYLDPKDPRTIPYVVIDLSTFDQGEYTIRDQPVHVDHGGFFTVVDTDGEMHAFIATVERPITLGDLG